LDRGNSTIGKILIDSLVRQGHTCYVISRSDVTPSHPSVKSLRINILEEKIPEDYLPEVLDGLVYLPGTINLKPFRALSAGAFREAEGSFEVVLLGLDGRVKLRQDKLLNCDRLYNTIDRMPMRQRELKSRD
jgi:hypothetical protein